MEADGSKGQPPCSKCATYSSRKNSSEVPFSVVAVYRKGLGWRWRADFEPPAEWSGFRKGAQIRLVPPFTHPDAAQCSRSGRATKIVTSPIAAATNRWPRTRATSRR